MENILVVGAGFMGSGIAQVCAQAGCRVYLTDVNRQALHKNVKGIKWSLEKFSAKGLLKESPQSVLERITTESDLSKASGADWVIEAALEQEDLKKDIFRELDRLAPARTPLATNTSSIPITRLARVTGYPARVLGLHFFGPVPFMGLVEVIRGRANVRGDIPARCPLCEIPGKNTAKSPQRSAGICHESHIFGCVSRVPGSGQRRSGFTTRYRSGHAAGIWLEHRAF